MAGSVTVQLFSFYDEVYKLATFLICKMIIVKSHQDNKEDCYKS